MNPSEALTFNRPLRTHQREALDRFAYENEMALLWEMGTGKTTAAIAWLRAKYNVAKNVKRTLIVSPVATLYNWKEEFKINAPEKVVLEVEVPYMRTKKTKYSGSEKAALIECQKGKIFVFNPESLDSPLIVKALKKWKPEIIIVDEAHRFKNPKSKRFKALLSISDGDYDNKTGLCIRDTERAILTGTLILNGYLDIWAQWRILDKGEQFGTNFFAYRDRYFTDRNAGMRGMQKYFPDYVPKKGIEPIISEKLSRRASRLRKTDCLDLPPLVYETRHVEMSDEQRRAYDAMESEMLAELREGTCAATNALSRVLRMLQILSGYVPVESKTPEALSVQFTGNPRLGALEELLEEIVPEHKVIVWCTFKENYRAIKYLLKQMKIESAELTGETVNRQEEIDKFQNDPACRVMISNPQAGGVGINLTAASYAIYFSRSYSLGDRLQSESRNHRGGSEQHKCITIIDLVCKGTLDEDVLAALLRKESFSDNVLERLRGKYEAVSVN